jgi:hypothetical protein
MYGVEPQGDLIGPPQFAKQRERVAFIVPSVSLVAVKTKNDAAILSVGERHHKRASAVGQLIELERGVFR